MTKINLHGVPQTLLLPLIGRAYYSQKSYSPLKDEYAVKLVDSIENDFSTIQKQVEGSAQFWMARAFQFDRAIQSFLQRYPNAVIVNLGAGLDTTFYRLDNGKLTWIDLDLPEVITLRRQFLDPSPRIHTIAQSVLDSSWIEEVKKFGHPIFIFAGGLFYYFTEEEVKKIFQKMAEALPQAEIIFDTISQRGLKEANKFLVKASLTNAPMQWGLKKVNEILSWSEKITLVTQIRYFEDIKFKYSFPLMMQVKMCFYDWSDMPAILWMKFTGGP